MKLPLRETGHEALRSELARWSGHASSALLRAEAVRACARYGREYAAQARAGLDAVALIPVDEAVLDRAATLEPPAPRTLDAIHLATALTLGDDLGVLVSYDDRLLAAADALAVPVVRPRS